jgi:hypothetical protein
VRCFELRIYVASCSCCHLPSWKALGKQRGVQEGQRRGGEKGTAIEGEVEKVIYHV